MITITPITESEMEDLYPSHYNGCPVVYIEPTYDPTYEELLFDIDTFFACQKFLKMYTRRFSLCARKTTGKLTLSKLLVDIGWNRLELVDGNRIKYHPHPTKIVISL